LSSDVTTDGHRSHHCSRLGRLSPPPQIAPREIVIAATARASDRRGHNRSCLGKSRPPRRSRLGLPLDDVAWGRLSPTSSGTSARASQRRSSIADVARDCRSCLTTLLASHAAGSRHRCPAAARHRSHLTLLQAPLGLETLIPRDLGYFYRRQNLIRLNRMARLSWPSCSYWKPKAYIYTLIRVSVASLSLLIL
jgi:hypothetical protein